MVESKLINEDEFLMSEKEEILELMSRLPDHDRLSRVNYTLKNGHLFILKDEGRVVGYGEFYVLREIPKDFSDFNPVNDPNGTILFCTAAVCEKGYVKILANMAKKTFKQCHFLVYQRLKHQNRLHSERNQYAELV